jgi:hypothetical protein
LTQILVVRLGGRAIVSVQNPLVLADDTQPQPDLAILRLRSEPSDKEMEPRANDVLLLIEVAETSLSYDRTAASIDVCRAPHARSYRDVRRVSGDATVTLQAFPEVAVMLLEIFA